MKIEIPDKVDRIINTLMEHGYEAYTVGGCVRDSILNREPGDWDITTSADPYEVKALFPRTIDTGIQHGTVTVMMDKDGFEVTTYRLDGEYEDNRHPKQVEFTKSLTEDLKRRDFTINAMAYNKQEGMVDLFEGMDDINRKMIRCVGSPIERFEEDALRILRAVRFSAQLGFSIEEGTKEAIRIKAPNLANISAERIREELNKLFLSMHPEQLINVYQLGISEIVLPELDAHMKAECPYRGEAKGAFLMEELKQLRVLRKMERDMTEVKTREVVRRTLSSKETLTLSYACLLQTYEEGKEIVIHRDTDQKEIATLLERGQAEERARSVIRRLKFDNDTLAMVSKLIRYENLNIDDDMTAVRKAINMVGVDMMDLWFLMREIECQADQTEDAKVRMEHLTRIYDKYQEIMSKGQCVDLKGLHCNGKVLIELGVQPGKELGEILSLLLDHVLYHPEENTTEILRERVKRIQSK